MGDDAQVPPSISLALANAALQQGIGYVPDPGDDKAPSTFRGEAKKLDRFLRKVDKIVAAHGLTTGADKTKVLFSYLGGGARNLMREHDAYKSQDYVAMVTALREAYPTRKHHFKYTSADLEKYARRQHKKKKLRTIEEVAKYQRGFETIGRWCLNNNRLEPERYNRLFWDGLPSKLQEFLKHNGGKYGISIDPLKTPDAAEVAKALRSYFSLDNFDAEQRYKSLSRSRVPDSDSSDSESDSRRRRSRHRRTKARASASSDSSDSESSSSSSEESDSDDSDSDSDRSKSKRMPDVKVKGKVRFSTPAEPVLSAPSPSAPASDSTVEELTRQLSSLDVNSTEYRSVWSRLASSYPSVAAAVIRAADSSRAANVNAISNRTPPHLSMPRPYGTDTGCFACGDGMHHMRNCEALRPWVDGGVLFRDQMGRLRMCSGTPLPPFSGGQPLLESLRKMGIAPRPPTTAPMAPPASYLYAGANAEANTPAVNFIELEEPPLAATMSVYGAQRGGQPAGTRGKPYDRPTTPQGAARTRASAARAAPAPDAAVAAASGDAGPTGQPAHPQPAFPGTSAAAPASSPYTAVAAGPQAAASVVGDAEMGDGVKDGKRQVRRYTLVSEISKSFPALTTLNTIINNPVTVPTGALLAQPDIQKILAPMLQRHKSFDVNHVDEDSDAAQHGDSDEDAVVDVSLVDNKVRRALLSSGVGRADVRIGGNLVTAILDSGSEINVISRAACERLRLPLTSYDGQMRTADGRMSAMTHLCCNVTIDISNVRTRAHLHVVNGPKYELLLGRPWQRQVRYAARDIDEGLLITIHDPVTHAPHSFIAAPAEQSDPRSSYRGQVLTSELAREVSHLVCSAELEQLLDQEDQQQEQALLAGRHTTRLEHATPSVLAAYKPVARKVKPVATSIGEDDRVKINIPHDFEADMPALPLPAPPFTPGTRLTRERLGELRLDPDGLLNEDELALLVWVLRTNERALAFDESEKGVVDENIVSPVRIPVVEHEVWDQKPIPIPAAAKHAVLQLLQQKIDSGLYEQSSAAYTSKWFPVAKKQPNAFRIVHDLQPLNGVTKRTPGRLPQIDTFVGELSGRACLGLLDQFSGFDQVWLAVESRDYTSFETPLGRMRLTRLPQGGTNSCVVFHYIVVAIVGPAGKVYVDDTFVPGPSSTYNDEPIAVGSRIRRFVFEYLTSLHRVLFRIGKSQMTVSARKMSPIRRTADVLGQEVGPEGRRVAQGKVEAIAKWERCGSVSEVRSFLGIAGQARAWVPNFSALVKPLTALTRKGAPFVWGQEQQSAMDHIKDVVAQRTFLVELKYGPGEPPIKLGVDAGPLACGFWLGQDDASGQVRVARYGSLPFNEREQGYSQAKRELYAIFRALKFFRHWLWGTKIVVLSDARFIKGMLANPELPNSAMVRWLAYIMLFDLEVVHVRAKDNELADGLSRRPAQPEDLSVTDDDEWISDRLEDFAPVVAPHDVGFLQLAAVAPLSAQAHLSAAADVQSPSTLTPEHQAIFDFLTSGIKPEYAKDFNSNKTFVKQASQYFVTGSTLWRRGGLEDSGRLVVDDVSERDRAMRLAHDEAGHKGVAATSRALEQRFFWAKMSADVKEWIKTCDTCQKRERGVDEVKIRPTAPLGPHGRIGIDITYLPKESGYRYLAVSRDDLSGWVEARPLKRKTARAVARFLVEEVFSRHGLPLQVTTDQGMEFKGVVDKLLCKYGVDIRRTSIYNPRANGAVERGHPPLKEAIVHASRALNLPWPDVVHLACWIDRTTTRRQYGHSPFFLLHGHEPLLPLDLTSPSLLERYRTIPDDEAAAAAMIAERISLLGSHQSLIELARKHKIEDRQKAAARRNLQDMLGEPSFAPAQLVLIRNFVGINSHTAEAKLQDKWLGPYKVLWQSISGGVWLSTLTGDPLPSALHPSHVKPYRPRIRPVLPPRPANNPEKAAFSASVVGDVVDAELLPCALSGQAY